MEINVCLVILIALPAKVKQMLIVYLVTKINTISLITIHAVAHVKKHNTLKGIIVQIVIKLVINAPEEQKIIAKHVITLLQTGYYLIN